MLAKGYANFHACANSARVLQMAALGSECENLAVSKCFLLNLDKLTLLITIASTESGQLIPIGSRN